MVPVNHGSWSHRTVTLTPGGPAVSVMNWSCPEPNTMDGQLTSDRKLRAHIHHEKDVYGPTKDYYGDYVISGCSDANYYYNHIQGCCFSSGDDESLARLV